MTFKQVRILYNIYIIFEQEFTARENKQEIFPVS